MQIIHLVTFLLIWLSYAKCLRGSTKSSTDIVEDIIEIKKNSTIECRLRKRLQYVLQNIGIIRVTIHGVLILQPNEKRIINKMTTFTPWSDSIQISNQDYNDRAILYLSNLRRDCIDVPVKGYDKNKVLKEAFALGVKFIPEKCRTLDKLIPYFWPKNKDNVWKQIFDVIKVLLDPYDQYVISEYITHNIGFLKTHIEDLMNNITKNDNLGPAAYQYVIVNVELNELYFKTMVSTTSHKGALNFYVLPLYSNFITLKMYLYELGAANPKIFQLNSSSISAASWQTLYNHTNGAIVYIHNMRKNLKDTMYETVYAGGLFNVMMNAYSHMALHGLDMFQIWTQIYYKTINKKCVDCNSFRLRAISYSNLYGRATPNLLEQAVHIEESSLSPHFEENGHKAAELDFISFNIINGTVCGLKLEYLPNFVTTIGTFDTAYDKNVQILDVSNNKKIIELIVYKNEYIRCLEFTVLDTKTLFGDNCLHNTEYFKFHLKDHYINSLYLANDDPDTGIYFDNIAVSYLSNPLNKL